LQEGISINNIFPCLLSGCQEVLVLLLLLNHF
jgi:hypothetical protein